MGNIFTSSIGKKLIMSISGLFLILFLLIHLLANSAYLFGHEAFDTIIGIMSSPVIVAMVPVLAAGFIIHIVYAILLTLSNLKARGSERYEVSNRAKTDSWASKNMFVLGVIVLGFLVLHLTHFWAKMQLPEFLGNHAENGNVLMEQTFGSLLNVIIYIVWFVALWFHLTHGFWSAFHTLGANNNKWINRLRVVSYVYATLIFVGFSVIAIFAYLTSNGII
ncbi:MAG: succinate dehydrogenase cytochrome b subunit [Bacteroidales bacterium]|nr:succinate dehydrogenase cytochrome b subunit [Bacteroidales bacterium]